MIRIARPATGPQPVTDSRNAIARWNYVCGVADGTFFGTYLVLADVNLVIPWFISQLTDQRWIVGLAVSTTILGPALFQMFAVRLLRRSSHRKRFYLQFSALRCALWCLMLPLLFWDLAGPAVILAAFLIAYTSSNLCVSFIALPWQEIIARTIPARRLSSFFGLRSFFSGLIGIGVAVFVRSYLGANTVVPLDKFGVLFAAGIVCIGIAAAISGLMKDPESPPVSTDSTGFWQDIRTAAAATWSQTRFRSYLFVRAAIMVAQLTVPLFILEGRNHYGVLAESIGTFTMVSVGSGIVASLLWSYVGDRFGLGNLTLGVGLVSALGPLLALSMPVLSAQFGAEQGWLLVFIVAGAASTGQLNVMFRGVIELPAGEHSSLARGFGNTVSGLASFSGPLIGLFADRAGAPAAFVLASAVVLVSLPLVRNFRRQAAA